MSPLSPEAERAREILAREDALKRVESAAAVAEAARAELEATMRNAYAAGLALRPIARAAGFSVEWTRRIIGRAS